MIRTVLCFVIFFTSTLSLAQEKKIIYKFKEYEKFDLGDLEIKGSIIAPGDISVKERRRKIFERDLMKKNDFDSKILKEIKFLR